MISNIPEPGSADAQQLGCRCPIMDNASGRGVMGLGKDWIVSGDCPVHSISLVAKKFGEEAVPEVVKKKVLATGSTAYVATYRVIQVKGGKLHRPREPTQARMTWFSSMLTDCGSVVTPVNVFNDLSDAMDYTGGRLQFLCQHCFKAELQRKPDEEAD